MVSPSPLAPRGTRIRVALVTDRCLRGRAGAQRRLIRAKIAATPPPAHSGIQGEQDGHKSTTGRHDRLRASGVTASLAPDSDQGSCPTCRDCELGPSDHPAHMALCRGHADILPSPHRIRRGLQRLARRTGKGSRRPRIPLNLPIALIGFSPRHGWARLEGSDCPAFTPTDAVPREQQTCCGDSGSGD
jgi:hypothetical protein